MSVRQYWIVYDISDDRERSRVERCLLRYGQMSSFGKPVKLTEDWAFMLSS